VRNSPPKRCFWCSRLVSMATAGAVADTADTLSWRRTPNLFGCLASHSRGHGDRYRSELVQPGSQAQSQTSRPRPVPSQIFPLNAWRSMSRSRLFQLRCNPTISFGSSDQPNLRIRFMQTPGGVWGEFVGPLDRLEACLISSGFCCWFRSSPLRCNCNTPNRICSFAAGRGARDRSNT
jgi:hypothetical protein